MTDGLEQKQPQVTPCLSVLDSAAVTPSSVSTGVSVPRRRFQRGSLVQKSGRWYGVFRKDALQTNGTFKREQCWQPLGLTSEQSERSAWKQFQPFLDSVNDAAVRMPPRTGLTLGEFVTEWRATVAVNLKGSTTRAAESHLRAHLIPKLGTLHLPEITTRLCRVLSRIWPVADAHEKLRRTFCSLSRRFSKRQGPGVMRAEISVSQTSRCHATE